MKSIVAAVVIGYVLLAGCGKTERTKGVPSSLVGSWRHKVDQDFLKTFAIEGKRIAEMVLTFDADGNYTEVAIFTAGQGEFKNAGTFTVEKESDEADTIGVSLSDGDGLFAGARLTLSGSGKLVAPLDPLKFTFTKGTSSD